MDSIQSQYVYPLLQLQHRKSVALKTVLVELYCVGLFFPEKPSAHVRGVNFLSAFHHTADTPPTPISVLHNNTHLPQTFTGTFWNAYLGALVRST